MYPNQETVKAAEKRIVPLAGLLRERGYDTAAIGDWCAGYYEIMPLGFEHISVSSFDNFKIYMSQAVVMAHFVVPLYFDNALGYRIFPQLQSFAQFVTPKVVTERVEKRLESAAANLDEVIAEVAAARQTERGTRADDKRSETAMEDRKREGYF
jgi:hypothetical protein